jgi:hypothetical protein
MILALSHSDHTFCGATIGHFLINLRGNYKMVAFDVKAIEHIEFYNLIATGDTVLYFSLSFYDKELFLATKRRLLLEGHYMLDTGILDACYNVFFHIWLQIYCFFETKEQKKRK